MKQIVEGRWPDLPVEEAFQKTTDGEDCPIARSYTPGEFGGLCESGGFDVTYKGGHLSRWELTIHDMHAKNALADHRLAERHKDFLRELEFDSDGYPVWNGKHAGVGGRLRAAQLGASLEASFEDLGQAALLDLPVELFARPLDVAASGQSAVSAGSSL